MLPEKRAFYVQGDDGRDYGPVELDELREWVQENRAGLGTAVRLDEPDSIWLPWHQYPELVALLAETRAIGGAVGVPGQPELAVAFLGKRFLALVTDWILSGILSSPIICAVMAVYFPHWQDDFFAWLAQPQNPMSPDLIHVLLINNLIIYLVLTLYMAGFHAAHGQTPAKAFLHLRVVDQNGQNPSLLRSLLRGLGLAISIYYLVGVISLIYARFNPQRRSFHDLLAGTYVVEA
jgi:uncharacterized RDD family membrane protein YckC